MSSEALSTIKERGHCIRCGAGPYSKRFYILKGYVPGRTPSGFFICRACISKTGPPSLNDEKQKIERETNGRSSLLFPWWRWQWLDHWWLYFQKKKAEPTCYTPTFATENSNSHIYEDSALYQAALTLFPFYPSFVPEFISPSKMKERHYNGLKHDLKWHLSPRLFPIKAFIAARRATGEYTVFSAFEHEFSATNLPLPLPARISNERDVITLFRAMSKYRFCTGTCTESSGIDFLAIGKSFPGGVLSGSCTGKGLRQWSRKCQRLHSNPTDICNERSRLKIIFPRLRPPKTIYLLFPPRSPPLESF